MLTKMPTMSGPQFINWNYTYICNFNCQHCYSRAASYPTELSTAQYMAIVGQIVEAQVFQVALGGGEVLLRDDCTLILAALARYGVGTMLTTNGWFVDAKWAGKLRDAGLARLFVSLDSPDATVHDAFRNRPGSFQRALQAIENATAAGLEVHLSVVLSSINVGALADLTAIATRCGLRGVNFKRFRPSGNGLLTKERYQLEDAEGAAIGEEVVQLRWKSGLDLTLNFGSEAGLADSGCGCGGSALAIRPNGDVAACVYGEGILGNLTVDKLAELWRKSPVLQKMRKDACCIARRDASTPSNPALGLIATSNSVGT